VSTLRGCEVSDGSRQGEGVGRDDAGVAFDVHEGLVVEILGVDDGRVEIGESLNSFEQRMS